MLPGKTSRAHPESSPRPFVRIQALDGWEVPGGDEIGKPVRLLKLSRFDCRIARDEALERTLWIDSMIEGGIEYAGIRFDRVVSGFFVQTNARTDEYTIQFSRAFNENIIHAILKAVAIARHED